LQKTPPAERFLLNSKNRRTGNFCLLRWEVFVRRLKFFLSSLASLRLCRSNKNFPQKRKEAKKTARQFELIVKNRIAEVC
jgi:hypothetical protein